MVYQEITSVYLYFRHWPSLVARFMGPTWGPSGADRAQVGPMLAPWTLLCGMVWYPTLTVFFVWKCFPHHWPVWGNPSISSCFPGQRLVMWSFDVLLFIGLIKLSNKQSSCWWFESSKHSIGFTVINILDVHYLTGRSCSQPQWCNI